jgi:nicotinate-nucleotide--dimethylbenzimidazole phosphoribosyltransferase
MKLQLTGLKQFSFCNDRQDLRCVPEGWIALDVSHCAICRTDAKMWDAGHRDLSLPRVPGHEIAGSSGGKRYTVWPGVACGTCHYCQASRENLCDSMKILGFHLDGGFSDTVLVPESNCLLIPDQVDSVAATFSEPAGCIVNAFDKIRWQEGNRLLIYGAGTMGILTALLSRNYKAVPVIIEKNEIKIEKAKSLCKNHEIPVVKYTNESRFDVLINCCADPLAFISSIPKAAKGAAILFFSGLEKNAQIDSTLLNLVHYRELNIIGSYGLTFEHLRKGLHLISQNSEPVGHLIEKVLPLQAAPHIMSEVVQGSCFKYVISFEKTTWHSAVNLPDVNVVGAQKKRSVPELLNFHIPEPSESMRAQACRKIDSRTKPLGSLGMLEKIAVKLCTVQNTLHPVVNSREMLIFAADHGIAEEGVSAFPQEVTHQMVRNFLNGGAAINALSGVSGLDLSIIDIGVKGSIVPHPRLIQSKIAEGTKNFAVQPAMTPEEAYKALTAGTDTFNARNTIKKIDIIGLGEMGIANSSSAAAVISAITKTPVSHCCGRGTGVDDQGLKHKIKTLEKALQFHHPDPDDAIDVLCKVGGFEIAGMAGAALAAASHRCIVVLDGLISTAAGLIACTINPSIVHYLIAGHKSVEIGQIAALEYMKLEPVLDLQMRLGEGTGAALTINLVVASCALVNKMASFDDAGISTSEKYNGQFRNNGSYEK